MTITNFYNNHKLKLYSALFIALFFAAYFFQSIFVYIYPGQAGLIFRSMAERSFQSDVYEPGLYAIFPWNKMYVYDLKKQSKSLDVSALTSNGVTVNLRVSTIFYPVKTELKQLAEQLGADYVQNILIPAIVSSSKKIVGQYRPESLYTTDTDSIQTKILDEVKQEVNGSHLVIEKVLIEKIELPKSINQAIEDKLTHQQKLLAYEFILEREVEEAKRRKIEADSLKSYNDVLQSSLSEKVLQWGRIKAIFELSKTQNSKVIVMDTEVPSIPISITTSDK